jgi:hypothetical protein
MREWVRLVSGYYAYALGYSDSVGHGSLDNFSSRNYDFYGMGGPGSARNSS